MTPIAAASPVASVDPLSFAMPSPPACEAVLDTPAPDPLLSWPTDAAPPVYPFLAAPPSTSVCSPDPLRGAFFDPALANSPETDLVCYALKPVAQHARPASAFTFDESKEEIVVDGDGDLFLDFAVESAGWIEFESEHVPEGVQLSISESNQPAVVNVGAQQPIKTGRPVQVGGTTWRLILNPDFYEGVRFAWIHSPGQESWKLRNLRLVAQARPANYLGDFRCSDPRLERIWEVGATSVRLNFLKDHIGAILMERSDRHSWTGDAHVSQAVAMPVFGNFAFVKANLLRTEDDTNGIEGFSLYWILSLVDYALCSGDIETLRAALPKVRAKLLHAGKVAREALPLVFCGHDCRTGSCFEEPEILSNHRYFRLFALRTVKQVQLTLVWIGGDAETTAVCESLQSELAQHVSTTAEAFGLHDGTEAVLAGIAVDHDFLPREYGNPATRVSYSPFNNYFVLQGMAKAGCFQSALGLLHRCWGGMLALGATTFWESFRPEWADFMEVNDTPPNGMHGYTSLCHPWSSGPTRWLLDYALGIRPTAPGYAEFVFDPAALGLERASGSVATPRGPIRAEWEGDRAWLEIPAGCRATVRTLDGTKVLAGGHHEIPSLVHTANQVSLPEPDQCHAGKWLADSELDEQLPSASEWIAFAAHPDGSDQVHGDGQSRFLPSDHKKYGHAWRHHFSDHQEGLPFQGALRTSIPNVVQQTFTVDIERPEGTPFRLGIYCRDHLNTGIVQTIEVFDLQRKVLLAPTRRISNFSKGVVLNFAYDRAVRIRVCHCPGPDAVLNGLLILPPL